MGAVWCGRKDMFGSEEVSFLFLVFLLCQRPDFITEDIGRCKTQGYKNANVT